MPRRLKQEKVVHLVKRGRASYADGKVPKPISVIGKAISVPNPVIQQDTGVLQACASISQSLVALKADLAKLDTKPDLSKLDEIMKVPESGYMLDGRESLKITVAAEI